MARVAAGSVGQYNRTSYFMSKGNYYHRLTLVSDDQIEARNPPRANPLMRSALLRTGYKVLMSALVWSNSGRAVGMAVDKGSGQGQWTRAVGRAVGRAVNTQRKRAVNTKGKGSAFVCVSALVLSDRWGFKYGMFTTEWPHSPRIFVMIDTVSWVFSRSSGSSPA